MPRAYVSMGCIGQRECIEFITFLKMTTLSQKTLIFLLAIENLKSHSVTFLLTCSCSCSKLQATIPGILCGPLTAELVTTSHGRWFPVFVLAAGVNFTGAVIYYSQSSAAQVL